MIDDFRNIEYLKHGNERQKVAYTAITKHRVLEKLVNYNPILTGTIPIDIDVPESDLDIICECKDHKQFSAYILEQFGDMKEFRITTMYQNGIEATVANFNTDNFEFEIFGQEIPTEKQNAYRHMLIEYAILEQKGNNFKQAVIQLKSTGLKTEPAFAKLLGIKGNPYIELLKLENKY